MKVDLSAGRVAAVVTDVQALFAAPDGPCGNDGCGPMVAAINELTAACRAADVPVIHSRYVLRADGADAGLLTAMQGLDAALLGADSPWVRVDDRVEIADFDLDSVHDRPSAFYASDLDAVLRGLGVDRLVLAGLSLNNAVAASARDAFARDLPVVVPREAVGAAPFESAEDIAAGFRALDAWTAEVAGLADVVARLERKEQG